jgi:tetratricopeptide (TPR) repeat protein
MTCTEPLSLSEIITEATRLTQDLLLILKQQTAYLAGDQAHEAAKLETSKNALRIERDKTFTILKELSVNNKPSNIEWQALLELQKLDIELTIGTLDNLIQAEPENVELLYHRAIALMSIGRDQDAQQDFLHLLNQQPGHLGALIDFGNLLVNTGRQSAAETLYAQAIISHPDQPKGYVNFANLLQAQGESALAKQYYLQALNLDDSLAEAHQGLSYSLNSLGEEDLAAIHRKQGFQHHSTMTWPSRGTQSAIPLMILSSARGGNIALKHILDERQFHSTLVFTEYFDQNLPFPDHQLVINAIGDADLCQEALLNAKQLLSKTSAPIINRPERVLLTGRLDNTIRLGKLPGVITARSVLISKVASISEVIANLENAGISFPFLVRSPGFHTGQFFEKVDTVDDLSKALTELPGSSLIAIELLDTGNAEGEWHKYRVMSVAGELYPLHLAISKYWKVHYYSANMNDQPKSRKKEEAFLHDMVSVLGNNVLSTLKNIACELQLDYFGMDFAVNEDNGEVYLFEANATMIIPTLENNEEYQYRQLATSKVQSAVRNMINNRLNS